MTWAFGTSTQVTAAEGVGFEPTVPKGHNGFRDRPIRPLSHPSGGGGYPVRFAAKKASSNAAAREAPTPGSTATSWLRRGSTHTL